MAGFIPYCGSPPVLGSLHWNFDPLLVGALLLLMAAHMQFAWSRGVVKRDLGASCLGWLLLSLALISPLCNLSVALFSARVTQHMAIALIAAPMIAQGFISARTSVPSRDSNIFAWGTTFAFAAVFWIWHSPAFYDETLRSNVTYWLMHATTVVAALALWTAVFSSSAPLAFLILFATGVQMSLLGALLTFAAVPLFSVHEFTTEAWGLTWLEDQQLGGLLMWVRARRIAAANRLFCTRLWRYALRLDPPVASPATEKAA